MSEDHFSRSPPNQLNALRLRSTAESDLCCSGMPLSPVPTNSCGALHKNDWNSHSSGMRAGRDGR